MKGQPTLPPIHRTASPLSRCCFIIVFLAPLLFFWGQHSLIAQDEGYYALQARWILQNHQWLAPQFFDHIVFDRTIGVQWLIALSYQLFGISAFTARLPSLVCGLISLLLTFKISEIFATENGWDSITEILNSDELLALSAV